jgi:serine/threonine protein kinase
MNDKDKLSGQPLESFAEPTAQFHVSSEAASRSAAEDPRVVDAVKRFMAMMESGNAPEVNAFCKEYPDIASTLEPCLAGLAMLQKGFGVKRPLDENPTHFAGSIASIDGSMPSALGDFQIVKEIGRGGMGVVYEAVQLSLGRRVALKVLSFAGALDAVRLQRFRNEAQAAAQLHHTHIVPVYAVGSDRGVHYYAMQLIEGRSLADVIASIKDSRSSLENSSRSATGANTPSTAQLSTNTTNTLTTAPFDSTQSTNNRSLRDRHFKSLAKMIVQAARGLDHAHSYGVVHRDIKPANIMLDPVGNIWITDFGLALVQTDSNLTRTGDLVGTLRYMSPEQASGGLAPIDHRTDIYSLGITLYELLTLQPAVIGVGYNELSNQIAHVDPRLPKSIDATIPSELETITLKSIAKDPKDRYATAAHFADDLQRWLDDKPILAKPPSLLQRFGKWRKRHAGLVAAGIGFLILSGVALLGTTIAVLREQSKTQAALERETTHRIASDISFQQARRAVDTFSQLGEIELANRPDLKTLRREFLETSLDFYRDFIDAQGKSPTLQEELSATMGRVEKLVEALKRLDRFEPLKLLAYPSVQNEIRLDGEVANFVTDKIHSVEAMEDGGSGGESRSEPSEDRVEEFEAIENKLTDSQRKRLNEIHRQTRLPFIFKSIEIAELLALTQDQRKLIGLIIEQERPDRASKKRNNNGRGMNNGRSNMPNNNRPPHEPDFPGPPPIGGMREPPMHGPRPGDSRFDRELIESQTKRTVERIIDSLDDQQKKKWADLIGEPFAIEY